MHSFIDSVPQRSIPPRFVKDKIYFLFHHLNTTIQNLLDHLNKFYRDNGITFPITHLHSILIRILTPYELMTQYGLVDNSNIISRNHMERQFYSKDDQTYLQNSDMKYEGVFEKDKNIPFINNRASFYREDPNQIRYPDQVLKTDSNLQKRKRSGRPRALNNQMQDQLAKWIVKQVSEGHEVSRRGVTKLACQLLNDPNFQGSDGWFFNFVKRHPEVKKLVVPPRKSQFRTENQSKTPSFYPIKKRSEQGSLLRRQRTGDQQQGSQNQSDMDSNEYDEQNEREDYSQSQQNVKVFQEAEEEEEEDNQK